MKKFILILTLLFIAAQAMALDSGSFEITVTINKAPTIEGFTPIDGHRITEDDLLEISVIADDLNNDTLQYQFYVNGVIKQAWTADSLFSYTLTGDDIGLNSIKAEVKDNIEIVQTGEVEIYVFRKSPDLPAEE